jgi:hypothetical protein
MEWTEQEESRLINLVLCGEVPIDVIAKLLGRTVASIRKKMIARNLRIVAENMEDRELILNDFHTERMTIPDIAMKYNKTLPEVKNVISWGKEQGFIPFVRDASSKWNTGDMVKLARIASLVDDRIACNYMDRSFDVGKVIKKFWGLNINYLIGIDIEEFAETFNVTEEDPFTIITTTIMKKDGSPLMVVPWVDCDMYEAKSAEVDRIVARMATFQKLVYQEMDREKVIDKMVKIIDNKYTEFDYYLVQ